MDVDDHQIVTSDSLPLIVGQHPGFNDVVQQQPVTSFYHHQGPSPWQPPVNQVPSFSTGPAVYNHQHEVFHAQQQQQQQQVQIQQLSGDALQEPVVYRKAGCRYISAIVLSVIAMVVVLPFGLAALILAVLAFRASSDSNRQSAARALNCSSLAVSIGAILFVVIVGLILVLVPIPWINWSTSQLNANDPAYAAAATTTTTAEPQCPNYLNGNCYPYAVRWNEGADGCQSGTMSADGSQCYYDSRDSTSSGQQQLCRGDLSVNDNYCYYMSDALCSGARNYHNRICYPYHLRWSVGTGSPCPHGFHANGQLADGSSMCYYDAIYRGSDDTCDGYKADGSTNGWCYYSSSAACRYAGNFINGECLQYGTGAQSAASCPHGFFVNGNCYYRNADYIGSDAVSGVFQCNPFSRDHFGNYCYYN